MTQPDATTVETVARTIAGLRPNDVPFSWAKEDARSILSDPAALRAVVDHALTSDAEMVLEAAVSAGVLQHSEMHAQNGAWEFYSTPLRKVGDE